MNSNTPRIAFAGTPDFAARHLRSLLLAQIPIVSVYSQPDRPAGRGKKLHPTPVKSVAEEYGIPVYQPQNFKDEAALQALADQQLDLLIVVAYGLLLPPSVLAMPRYGCINVHPSLLPRWRGAAPIERAILSGDKETGVCIMQMDAGLDTGNILYTSRTDINEQDNSETLAQRLTELGSNALLEVISRIGTTELSSTPQDPALVTYAAKLSKEEAHINWTHSASDIQRQVNAFFPRSPAFTYLNTGTDEEPYGPVRIIKSRTLHHTHNKTAGSILDISTDSIDVACQDSILRISELQLPGKKAMPVKIIRNGHPDLFTVSRHFLSEPKPS